MSTRASSPAVARWHDECGAHAALLIAAPWPRSAAHGTDGTRKIGRQSSDGCIGLFNAAIAELFEITPIGTQVRVI